MKTYQMSVDSITKYLEIKKQVAEKELQSIRTKLNADGSFSLSETMRWYGDDMSQNEVIVRECTDILQGLNLIMEEEFGNYKRCADELAEQVGRYLIKMLQFGPSRSTNPYANSIEDDKHKAYSDLVRLLQPELMSLGYTFQVQCTFFGTSIDVVRPAVPGEESFKEKVSEIIQDLIGHKLIYVDEPTLEVDFGEDDPNLIDELFTPRSPVHGELLKKGEFSVTQSDEFSYPVTAENEAPKWARDILGVKTPYDWFLTVFDETHSETGALVCWSHKEYNASIVIREINH